MPRVLRVSLALLLVCAVGMALRAVVGAWVHPQPRIFLTVIASVVLLVGAGAGLRGHLWGVLLASLTAITFGGAVAFGVAPLWFCGVTVLGLLPLGLVAAPLYRRDRAAFLVWAAVSVAGGVAAAAFGGPGVSWLRSVLP